jgi:hypothetical protein
VNGVAQRRASVKWNQLNPGPCLDENEEGARERREGRKQEKAERFSC